MPYTVKQIAYAVHENNLIIQSMLNDALPGVPWASESAHTRKSIIDGVLCAMNLIAELDLSEEERARRMHENWMDFKVRDGWTWGKVKDPVAKKHPLLVDYDMLPPREKVKGFMALSVVRVFTQRSEG